MNIRLAVNSSILVALLAVSMVAPVLAEQEAPQDQQAEQTQKEKTEAPQLSELIPAAAELDTRLFGLQSQLQALPDDILIKKQFAEVDARIVNASQQFEKLQDSAIDEYLIVYKLREDLTYETDVLAKTSQPVETALQRLDEWDSEWQHEKQRWADWQISLFQERSFSQLGDVFAGADATIDDAQQSIRRYIASMLAVQAMGANVKNRLDILDAKLRGLIQGASKDFVLGTSPPMYTAAYFSQYDLRLWHSGWQGIELFSRGDSRFFIQHAIFYCLVLVAFFILTVGIYRHREALGESERLGFIARRPVATALFLCSLFVATYLEFLEPPSSILLLNTVIAGFSCVRLLVSVLESPWQKYAAFGVVISYILVILMISVGLSVSLFRLYTLIVSLLGVRFFLKWAAQSAELNEPGYYALVLRLLALLFIAILLAEFWGKAGLATYLLTAALESMAIILPTILFFYIVRAFAHWLFYSSPLWQIKLMRNDAGVLAKRISFLIEALTILLLVIPALLTAWAVYDNIPEAINGLLAPGFYVGEEKISIGVIIVSMAILYGSSLVARILPKVMLDEQISGRNIERGVRQSIGRLMQYSIALVGFTMVLVVIGLDLTKLTIMVSAFGIGIGFGLQGIVSNFVSGLILLFERPLREDDNIEINNAWAQIKKIGLRSTTVRTWDGAEIIIPNADLTNSPVTNWTLSNREIRLRMPVGVAYGSDVPLVEKTLMECIKAHKDVISSPAPQVLFLNFGESSLDFELRVWIRDDDERMRVRSELYRSIESRFRELDITIPFPQRDLHLRSIDGAPVREAAELPVTGVIKPQTAE